MKASFYTESILYWLARATSEIVQRLSPSASARLGRWAGNAAFCLLGRRRKVALKNLRAAFGREYTLEQHQQILKEMFQNLGMTFMEVARLPRFDREYMKEWIQIPPESRQRLEAALSKGHGAILLTAHFGNWELGGIVSALEGYPMLVLAREQGWPRLNGLLTRYRESKGCEVVTKGFPLRRLIRGLQEEGKVVGILADQDGGRNGLLAPFFGRLASTAPGAAALSISTGAPLLPSFVLRKEGAAHAVLLGDPLPIPESGTLEERVRAGVELYLRRLEEMVRRAPSQWLWLHRRWKSSPERRALLMSDGKTGHLNQSRALVEKMEEAWKRRCGEDRRLKGIHRPLFKTEVVEVKYRHPLARWVLGFVAAVSGGGAPGADRWLRLCLSRDSYDSFRSAYADYSISCGAGAAPVNLLWGRALGCRTVHLNRSVWPSWKRFDLAVVPEHDHPPRVRPPNLWVIQGALVSRHRAEIGREGDWRRKLNLKSSRQIGLLIGGPAKGVELKTEQMEEMLGGLLRAVEALDGELLITTSRRTPPLLESLLLDRLLRHPRCRLLTLANRNEAGGLGSVAEAVPCILGLSEALVVSGDSISMVSEALESMKPVVAFLPLGTNGSKYHRFLGGLSSQGALKLVAPAAVGEAVCSALLEKSEGSEPKGPDPLVERLVSWL
ncbi:MAG: mitochondrial fission ELM1 family protein [Candidatus Omnitrophica bacterium]|nr:mitochondrial fission ELM1 family protein [Candidatus Omnitrophota bacterium]